METEANVGSMRGTKTSAAISIDNLKRIYDANCKEVLVEKQILARILKYWVPEFKDASISDIETKYIEGTPELAQMGVFPGTTNSRIQGTNTEDKSSTEGEVRFDIRFNAIAPSGDKIVKLIINIEQQGRKNTDYSILRRMFYYGCRLVSSQYGSVFQNAEYDKIEKVYSIWIFTTQSTDHRSSLTRFGMQRLEDGVGDGGFDANDMDLMEIIAIQLGYEDDSNGEPNGFSFLETIFDKNLKREIKKRILNEAYGIQITTQFDERLINMCSADDDLLLDFQKERAEEVSRLEADNARIEAERDAEKARADKAEAVNLRLREYIMKSGLPLPD